MAITAAMVKELRETTGAGMMDAKKALTEADGDFDKAVEILRVKGQDKMKKRGEERTASAGLVANAGGALVELNSETDFVAKNDEFIAAAQIVVYAGAVMVLYLFVSAYVGDVSEPMWDPVPGQRLLAPALALVLFIEVSIAVIGTALTATGTPGVDYEAGFGSPAAIGELFLERFLVVFEGASLLLLAAAIGAVVLAGRRRGRERDGEVGAPETLGTEMERPTSGAAR